MLVRDAATQPYHTASVYFDASKGYAEFPYLRICNENKVNATRAAELAKRTTGALSFRSVLSAMTEFEVHAMSSSVALE